MSTFHQHEKALSDSYLMVRHWGATYKAACDCWFAAHMAWQMDAALTAEQRRSLEAQSTRTIAEIRRHGEKMMTLAEYREECLRFDWRCESAICPELRPLYITMLERLRRIASRGPAFDAVFQEHVGKVEEFYHA